SSFISYAALAAGRNPQVFSFVNEWYFFGGVSQAYLVRMTAKGFDLLPKGVEEIPFYHGLLPREDVVELLAEVGDFMLRISQPKPTDPRELIISVRVAKDNAPSSIRHIIVRRQKFPQGEVKYLAVEALGFDTVDDLLQYYITQKTPINPQIKTSVLVNAVKRKPWEFHHEEITLKKLLGAGAFGEVRAGEVMIKGRKVECAIKLAKIVKDEAQLIHAKEKIKEMMHEARLMRHYDHDNVVRIYGVAVDREPLMILIELIKTSVLVNAVKRKPWEFHHEEITLKKLLGAGAFGEVRAGEVMIKGRKVECAIKLAKIVKDEAQLIHAKEKIKEMMHEARLMRHYDHDNVVRIYGVAVDREPLMILIELVKGGSILGDLRKRHGTITNEEKLNNMVLGSAKGIAYLHSKGCIHRDIAARNVLYTNKKVAKISDFGMSREGGKYRMRRCMKVPIKWTAPETITSFTYSLKTDVFSFSILTWEVFSNGKDPYKGMTNTAVKKMVIAGFRMEIPECPEGVSNLIEHCWEQNPDTRWSMDEAVAELERIAKKEAIREAKHSLSSKRNSESSEHEDKEKLITYSTKSAKNTKSCMLGRSEMESVSQSRKRKKKSR
ncbi:Tyrosine-protein kinase Fer, partial [Toxocara canis]